jgi:DNA-binding IclR family transcriptional regulator
MGVDSKDQYFSKTLEKGLLVLSLFDRDHTRLSLSQISRMIGINKTSAYRLVNTLVSLGYINKNSRSKALRLGVNTLVLGYNFLHGFELLQAAKPLIDETFSKWKMTIDSALLSGFELLALYRREAPGTVFFRHPLVSRDLHARAMGKAVLSQISSEEFDQVFETMPLSACTQKTITDRDRLTGELEGVRSRGYSVNNEEYVPGLVSIGAPLMNYQNGRVMGAISFDFASAEAPLNVIERKYSSVLIKLAKDLSEIITITEN